MEDNKMVKALVTDILNAVNAYSLPLAVKALALENVSLRVQAAIVQQELNEAQQEPDQGADPNTEPEQEE